MSKQTLDDRVCERANRPDRRSVKDKVRYRFRTPQYHVRAELDRLARMARKGIASGNIVSPAQVIDLINAAKR